MTNENSHNRPYDVLVVEDNADDVELLLSAMRKVQADLEIQINAQAISSGALAAEELKEHKFDAIFLDINLPPPDGMELAKQIRSSTINRTTPIVILTGADGRGLMTRAFQAGANMFLFKPIDRRQLLRLLQVARVPIDRERRQNQRVKVKCKVSMEFGKDRLAGETLDLSLTGIFVRVNGIFPIGSVVDMSLTLPQAQAPIRTGARVVRIVQDEFMGVQFQNIGKAESEKLGEYLVPLIVAATQGN